MKRFLRISVIALLVLGVLGNAGFAAAAVATREPARAKLTADRIKAASQPAIVLIQANYTITTSLPAFTIPRSKQDLLVNQVVAMIQSGKVAANQAAAERALINLVLSHPDTYYVPGARSSDDWDLVSTGSGFFVTEDGYLVTAAHVVNADKKEILAETLSLYKEPASIADLRKTLANSFVRDTGYSMTSAQLNSMVRFEQRWLDKYLRVEKVDVKYYLAAGSVETGDRLTGTGARASVVSIDPTTGGHDIAILKADITGAPTLNLAAGEPHMGQATYAIGYPRQGYLDEAVPLDQTIPATMTTGSVVDSAARAGGWTAWGTDAEFTHGDSGGPVVDADGNVIGVISFIFADEQGKQLPGQGYFVPVQYVLADLAGDSVKTSNGPTTLTSIYYHALAEGDIKRYRTELGLLQQIQTQSPFHAYIKDDISNTQTQILSGRDQTPPDLDAYVMASPISAGVVIALAIMAWAGLALAGRRSPKPVVEMTAQTAAETPAVSVADIVRESEPIPGNGVPHPPAPPPPEPAETQQP